jgi:hypothetical protein
MSGVGAMKQGTNLIKDAALATGGFILANQLGKFIPGSNNLLKAGGKVVAAILTAKMIKGETGKYLATGMAVSAVVDAGKQFAPQFFSGVGEEPTILISGIDDDSMGDIPTMGDIDSLGNLDQLGDIPTLGALDDEF